MTFSSSLADDRRPLVLDTSVLINLHACTYGERVLTAITNDIVIPDVVAGELDHETSRRNGDQSFLHDLITRGKVTVIGMTDAEYNCSLLCPVARLLWMTGRPRRSRSRRVGLSSRRR